VVITEFQPYRIEEFDASGRFVQSYGGRGEGPGEFFAPGFISEDGDGNIHHWNRDRGVMDVYASDGRLVRSWAPKFEEAAVQYWLQRGALNPDGTFSALASVARPRDRIGSARSGNALLTTTLDGKVISETPQPEEYGPPALNSLYRVDSGREPYTTPHSPFFSAWFVHPGIWASAHSGEYRILLHRSAGGLLRIESDLTPTSVSGTEREDLAAEATTQMQFTDKSAKLSAADVPAQKPFFGRVTGDASSRLWVLLNVQGTRTVKRGCPANNRTFGAPSDGAMQESTHCEDGLPKREMPSWRMPSTFDVFLPTGEFAGRLTMPDSTTFLNARNNKLWVRRLDSLGINSLVQYRISATAGSGLEAYWLQR
jgi:hypothetical protein